MDVNNMEDSIGSMDAKAVSPESRQHDKIQSKRNKREMERSTPLFTQDLINRNTPLKHPHQRRRGGLNSTPANQPLISSLFRGTGQKGDNDEDPAATQDPGA